MKFSLKYREKLTVDQDNYNGLLDCRGRDTFEKAISRFIVPASSGN